MKISRFWLLCLLELYSLFYVTTANNDSTIGALNPLDGLTLTNGVLHSNNSNSDA